MEAKLIENLIQSLNETNTIIDKIHTSLNKPDLIGLLSVIMVPISIFLTYVITNHQNRKTLENQTQIDLIKTNYPRFKKMLSDLRNDYYSTSGLSKPYYSWWNLLSSNLKHIVNNFEEEPVDSRCQFVEKYIQILNQLEESMVEYRFKLRKFINLFSEIKSNFEPDNEVYKELDNIQMILSLQIQKFHDHSNVAGMILIKKMEDLEELKDYAKIILLMTDPFINPELETGWEKTITLLSSLKIK